MVAEFLMSGQNGTKCKFTEVRIFRFFSLNNQRPDKLCSSSTITRLDIFRLGCRHGYCHRRTNLFVAMLDRAHLAIDIVARDAIEDIAPVRVILFKEEQGKRNDYQSQKHFTRQAFATSRDIVEFGVLHRARKVIQILNDLCGFFQDPVRSSTDYLHRRSEMCSLGSYMWCHVSLERSLITTQLFSCYIHKPLDSGFELGIDASDYGLDPPQETHTPASSRIIPTHHHD